MMSVFVDLLRRDGARRRSSLVVYPLLRPLPGRREGRARRAQGRRRSRSRCRVVLALAAVALYARHQQFPVAEPADGRGGPAGPRRTGAGRLDGRGHRGARGAPRRKSGRRRGLAHARPHVPRVGQPRQGRRRPTRRRAALLGDEGPRPRTRPRRGAGAGGRPGAAGARAARSSTQRSPRTPATRRRSGIAASWPCAPATTRPPRRTG